MPLGQRRLLTFCPKLQRSHCLSCVLSASEHLKGRGPAHSVCLCLGNLSWTQPSTSGSPWVPSPTARLPLTFCLSSQVPRQAWRIACGMACSLLFPAWVVTNMQSWQSESCGSHSPGRDPRAGRAREKNSRIPVLTGAVQMDLRRGGDGSG